MSNINTDICREALRLLRVDLNAAVKQGLISKEETKGIWVYKTICGSYEFCAPHYRQDGRSFHCSLDAENAYDARAQGINKILEKISYYGE